MKKPYVYTFCTLYIFRVCFVYIFTFVSVFCFNYEQSDRISVPPDYIKN